jgi:hypothetical protein
MSDEEKLEEMRKIKGDVLLKPLFQDMEGFAKKTKEAAAYMDGNGYLHAVPKEKKQDG